jgi:hypothetical protein
MLAVSLGNTKMEDSTISLKLSFDKPTSGWQVSSEFLQNNSGVIGKIINVEPLQKKNMKKNKTSKIIYAAAVLMVGVIGHIAMADTQVIPFTPKSSGTGGGCPGIYTGFATMTNSVGTFALTPPTNATSGTFTDTSGFGAPYVSVACVTCGLSKWCDTNSVTFPATNSLKYSCTVYVKSPLPPPTNGQSISLQIVWH